MSLCLTNSPKVDMYCPFKWPSQGSWPDVTSVSEVSDEGFLTVPAREQNRSRRFLRSRHSLMVILHRSHTITYIQLPCVHHQSGSIGVTSHRDFYQKLALEFNDSFFQVAALVPTPNLYN